VIIKLKGFLLKLIPSSYSFLLVVPTEQITITPICVSGITTNIYIILYLQQILI
jgi:hypothetical protein